jgi:hypothetical protein
LRFPAIEVVLACFIAVPDPAARPASARTSIAAALSPPAPNTGVLLVEFDLAALRAAQDLELADRRPAVAATELADRCPAVAVVAADVAGAAVAFETWLRWVAYR